MKKQTREEWLNKLTNLLRPDFKRLGFPLPEKLRVSCGWPLGRALPNAKGSRAVGQCFPPEWSKRKYHEIFISPYLATADKVGPTLVHELCHAAVGTECGHKGAFKRVAVEMGLMGKMTATQPGRALRVRLNALYPMLGRYPHAVLDVSRRKKQGTRLVKLECDGCGYVVRTTQKWIELGLPTCFCGGEFHCEVMREND